MKTYETTKKNWKRNPRRARWRLEKMLSHEMVPEDTFVFEGIDISEERYKYYRGIIR